MQGRARHRCERPPVGRLVPDDHCLPPQEHTSEAQSLSHMPGVHTVSRRDFCSRKEAVARPHGIYLPEGTGPDSGDGTESTSGSQGIEDSEGKA